MDVSFFESVHFFAPSRTPLQGELRDAKKEAAVPLLVLSYMFDFGNSNDCAQLSIEGEVDIDIVGA